MIREPTRDRRESCDPTDERIRARKQEGEECAEPAHRECSDGCADQDDGDEADQRDTTMDRRARLLLDAHELAAHRLFVIVHSSVYTRDGAGTGNFIDRVEKQLQ